MTVRTMLFVICLGAAPAAVFAQPTEPPGPAPQAATPRTAAAPQPNAAMPPDLRRTGQSVNIRVDVTITDQHAGAQPVKKTVTVVTGDGMSGFIRTQAFYSSLGEVPLNIDTEPQLLSDGKIRLRVNLQYDLPGGGSTPGVENTGAGALRKTAIRENLAVILDNGKPLLAAQSADPVGDRQVTIEVKATALR